MTIKVEGVEITLTEDQKQEICKGQHKYPLFKRNIHTQNIVKFTSLNGGEVVWSGDLDGTKIGYSSQDFIPHTDSVWENVAYDEKRSLFDRQPVYCWDDDSTHARDIKFYDAVNCYTFSYYGRRNGYKYNNFEAIKPEHYTPWMLEAFKTLGR